MTRGMTEDQKRAIREGAERASAEKAEARGRRIEVGAWTVYRFDEWNIAVQKGDAEPGFYPDTCSAVKALLRKITDPAGKQSIADHVAAVEKAEGKIVEAIARYGGIA